MNSELSPPSFREPGTDEHDGPSAAVLGGVLEIASAAVGAPVGARSAWRAVSDAIGGSPRLAGDWLGLAEQAALALDMPSEHRVGACDELVEELRPGTAAVLTDGETWWVVHREEGWTRGRPLRVVQLSSQGQSSWKTSRAQLRALIASPCRWLHFGPRLALDAIGVGVDATFGQRPWARLRAFLRLERRDLGLVVVYAIFVGVLTLATPVAVQALVNTIAFGSLLQPLFVLSVLLLAALVFSSVLRAFETYVVEVLQRRIFVRVAEDLGRRVPRLEASGDTHLHRPELLNRFFEVVTMQKALSVLLLDGLGLALQMIAGMLLLAFYHPLLLVFDIVLALVLMAVLWMGRGAVATATAESDAKYEIAGWLEMLAMAPARFRSRTGARFASGWTQALCRDYLSARRRHFRILMRQISGGLGLQVFATVALLGVGGFLVISRELTLGQLVAAELVISAVAAGFAKLGKHFEKSYDLVVAVRKLGKIVDMPCERQGGEPLHATGPCSVALEDLSIQVGSRTLLSGLDHGIEAGERVGLQAPSGAGKSIFLEVLAGLRRPAAGALRWNGLDWRRADLETVRERVALVGTPSFLHASIIDNIRLRRPRLDEATLGSWLRTFELDRIISALPEGLETPLLPDGAPLSTTAARRLALLIALLSEPGLLLLDGALDGLGLDAEGRKRVLDIVLANDAPWTTVVVSEDPEVAARCTRQLHLTTSRVEETR